MQDYEQYCRLLAAKMHEELGRQVGAEYQHQGLTKAQVIEKMEEDRDAVYRERYGPDK